MGGSDKKGRAGPLPAQPPWAQATIWPGATRGGLENLVVYCWSFWKEKDVKSILGIFPERQINIFPLLFSQAAVINI